MELDGETSVNHSLQKNQKLLTTRTLKQIQTKCRRATKIIMLKKTKTAEMACSVYMQC